MNYTPGQIVPNAFTVSLGSGDGAFNIYVSSQIHFIVDITGYYAPPGTDKDADLTGWYAVTDVFTKDQGRWRPSWRISVRLTES